MRDPELRSPEEWAEELRVTEELGAATRWLTLTDCRELADRMDDLTEALRLLRRFASAPGAEWVPAADALLAKYASEEG